MKKKKMTELEMERIKFIRSPIFKLYLLVALIMITLIMVYLMAMRGNSFSTDPEDWAFFGAFLSPIFSLLASLLFLFSLIVNNGNLQRQLKEDRAQYHESKLHQERLVLMDKVELLSDKAISFFMLWASSLADYMIYYESDQKSKEFRKKADEVRIGSTIRELEEKAQEFAECAEKYSNTIIEKHYELIDLLQRVETLIYLYFNNEYGASFLAYIKVFYTLFSEREKNTKVIKKNMYVIQAVFKTDALIELRKMSDILPSNHLTQKEMETIIEKKEIEVYEMVMVCIKRLD